MFDFDVGKLVVIGVVALVVIGPKDLPRVLRQVGQVVGKMRRMASEFQTQFMDAMREADVADLKTDLEKTVADAGLDVAFDPLKDAHEQIVKAVESDPVAAAPAETMDMAQPPVATDDDALEPPAPPKLARARKAKAVVEPAPDSAGENDEPVAPKKRASRKKAEPAAVAPSTEGEA